VWPVDAYAWATPAAKVSAWAMLVDAYVAAMASVTASAKAMASGDPDAVRRLLAAKQM
jgi:hypothetical protein